MSNIFSAIGKDNQVSGDNGCFTLVDSETVAGAIVVVQDKQTDVSAYWGIDTTNNRMKFFNNGTNGLDLSNALIGSELDFGSQTQTGSQTTSLNFHTGSSNKVAQIQATGDESTAANSGTLLFNSSVIQFPTNAFLSDTGNRNFGISFQGLTIRIGELLISGEIDGKCDFLTSTTTLSKVFSLNGDVLGLVGNLTTNNGVTMGSATTPTMLTFNSTSLTLSTNITFEDNILMDSGATIGTSTNSDLLTVSDTGLAVDGTMSGTSLTLSNPIYSTGSQSLDNVITPANLTITETTVLVSITAATAANVTVQNGTNGQEATFAVATTFGGGSVSLAPASGARWSSILLDNVTDTVTIKYLDGMGWFITGFSHSTTIS